MPPPDRLKQTHSEERALHSKGYKLISKLGEGGYATVYLGNFRANGEVNIPLACKVINIEKVPRRFVQKFVPRELRTLAKLNHPHIIQVHSIFQRKKKIYIFMRNAEKGDLLELVMTDGVIRESQARIWMRQIALALQYLHVLEIAHRDVKCENVLVTSHNNVKLSDFGFARSVLGDNYRKEMSETYCGSITYVPPEILRAQPYNPKISDLWSFGVIIYTILNGSYPFDTKNVKLLYQHQMEKHWKFRSKYANVLSEEVKSLITSLLEPNVTLRIVIEDVINSAWIGMESKLKTLNSYEYAALNSALEEAKSLGRSSDPYEGPRHRISAARKSATTKNSITFIKEYDGAFDLQLIRSDVKD